MNFLQKVFGRSETPVGEDKLAPFLVGIRRPLEETAVEPISLALRHIPDRNAQGRFMLSLTHVCLASILNRLDAVTGLPRGFSKAFKEFAISLWDRPPGMTVKSLQKMFEYTQQQIGDKLEHSHDDGLVDVGLTLLSIALLNDRQFATNAVVACGQAAHDCWNKAALEADKVLGIPPEIDTVTAKIGEQVYLMSYTDHYGEILRDHLNRKRLAELFLFRGWTAQFGYRIFSTDRYASEKLIGEVVNSSKYLGLGVFEQLHGFSIESELQADFMTLIEDRWREYDLLVSTTRQTDRIPAMEVVGVLTRHLGIADASVTYNLSIDFLAQIDFVKKTAMEIGILAR